MLIICLFFLLLVISFMVVKLCLSEEIFARLLFLSSLTNLTALFIAFLGAVSVNSSYLDIALIYFLLSFIAMSGYLRYFLQSPDA